MPIKMLSWNSNDINHTSVVPKRWFNQCKVRRASVREPFSHITFYFSGRCSCQLCTQSNQTSSQLLWEKVCKRSGPCSGCLRNQHISDSAWCLHTPMWTGAGKNSWSIWNISLKIKAHIFWGLRTIYFYGRQSGVTPFSRRIFQDARAF